MRRLTAKIIGEIELTLHADRGHCQAVRAELPEVLVYLHENSGSVLNDKLLNGQLDMAVLYDRSPVAGITSQPLLKEDLYLVGTRDCPGQSVDLTAVAEMNLYLPRDYSAVRVRVDEAFSRASPDGQNHRRDRTHSPR